MHLLLCWIWTFKCISKFSSLTHSNASPTMIHLDVHVYLSMTSVSTFMVSLYHYQITTCKCVFKFTQLHPPCISPISITFSLQVYLWILIIVYFTYTCKFTGLSYPSLPNHCLYINLYTHIITIPKCFCNCLEAPSTTLAMLCVYIVRPRQRIYTTLQCSKSSNVCEIQIST